MRFTAYFRLETDDQFMFAHNDSTLAIFKKTRNRFAEQQSNSIFVTSKPTKAYMVIVFDLSDEKFDEVFTLDIDFVPTHIQVSNNKLCIYRKTEKNKYRLHIIQFTETQLQMHQQFDQDKRCKTLSIDGNDVILVMKGRKDNYFLQRFSQDLPENSMMFQDSQVNLTQKVDAPQSDSENGYEEEYEASNEQKLIATNNSIAHNCLIGLGQLPLFGDIQMQASQQLEYQFRTCYPSDNFIIAGRFDTYLLMEKRRKPGNCVLHAKYLISDYHEKVHASGNGYSVVSVEPDGQYLNLYENYQFKQKLTVDNKKKLLDVCMDSNSSIFAVTENCKLMLVGKACQMMQRIRVDSFARFCLNKQFTQILVNQMDRFYYGNCVIEPRFVAELLHDVVLQDHLELQDQITSLQGDVKDQEMRRAKVVKFEKIANMVKVYWKSENGEVQESQINFDE